MELSDLPSKVQSVVQKFVNRAIERFHPLGIILVGSFTKDYHGPNSDVDIYIVVPDQDWRIRGNTWLDGIELEYFVNPVRQIEAYMEHEDGFRPITADMLATGIVLEKFDPVIDELINEAKRRLSRPLPELSGVDLELVRYSIDDLKKDLMDLSDTTSSYAYQQTLWKGIEVATQAILRHHRTYAERLKIRRQQLRKLDPKFVDLLDKISAEPLSVDAAIRLIEHVEEIIGRRPEEWELRSELKL